jgi:hypothetical protein
MEVLPSPKLHLRALALLLAGLILSAVGWGAVHASRPDKLPTLVWAPTLEAIVVMSKVDAVLEPLGAGWWWVRAAPADRQALRASGAWLALALPAPVMVGGCSDALALRPQGQAQQP